MTPGETLGDGLIVALRSDPANVQLRASPSGEQVFHQLAQPSVRRISLEALATSTVGWPTAVRTSLKARATSPGEATRPRPWRAHPWQATLARLQRVAPNVRLVARAVSRADIRDRLDVGDVDIGLSVFGDLSPWHCSEVLFEHGYGRLFDPRMRRGSAPITAVVALLLELIGRVLALVAGRVPRARLVNTIRARPRRDPGHALERPVSAAS